MPAIVGAIKVQAISTSSILHVGDVYMIHPYAEVKTFAGGGSFNTGANIEVHLGKAQTILHDQDQFDQVIAGNLG
ncbi:spore germination protein [Amphibacillus cookii]|uniref:spore germination protein n=1 Tax=Amphibacillus cookii TaxID=767787 RepID=UPI00195B7D19|nr:spore germination protein [Amphibacillus cookii]MBM7540148.1 spore germination protein PA [Amphibacillus cookii]